MTNFEAKRYVASDADIRDLATDSLKARSSLDKTRSTYLRVLIGTTQERLRAESVPAGAEQLRIAREVHRHFYGLVEETVMTKDIKKEHRAHERQRRTGFARSASSTLNSWLKVEGHDLRKLPVAEVTKAFLAKQAAPRNPHTPTEDRTMAKVAKYVEGLIASVRPFASTAENAPRAREILEEAVRALTNELRTLKPVGSVSPLTQTRIDRQRRKRVISKKAA